MTGQSRIIQRVIKDNMIHLTSTHGYGTERQTKYCSLLSLSASVSPSASVTELLSQVCLLALA